MVTRAHLIQSSKARLLAYWGSLPHPSPQYAYAKEYAKWALRTNYGQYQEENERPPSPAGLSESETTQIRETITSSIC